MLQKSNDSQSSYSFTVRACKFVIVCGSKTKPFSITNITIDLVVITEHHPLDTANRNIYDTFYFRMSTPYDVLTALVKHIRRNMAMKVTTNTQ